LKGGECGRNGTLDISSNSRIVPDPSGSTLGALHDFPYLLRPHLEPDSGWGFSCPMPRLCVGGLKNLKVRYAAFWKLLPAQTEANNYANRSDTDAYARAIATTVVPGAAPGGLSRPAANFHVGGPFFFEWLKPRSEKVFAERKSPVRRGGLGTGRGLVINRATGGCASLSIMKHLHEVCTTANSLGQNF
jgi:hypothetical protein